MKLPRRIFAFVLALACVAPAGADSVDSICSGFVGKWKLDFTKSHIGPEKEVPKEVLAEISYSKPELHVRLSKLLRAGTNVADYRYFTDGRVATNSAEGMQWKTISMHSAGRDLFMEQKARFLVFTVDVSDRWSLSPDQKELTIDRVITSLPRNDKILYVFERQS